MKFKFLPLFVKSNTCYYWRECDGLVDYVKKLKLSTATESILDEYPCMNDHDLNLFDSDFYKL